MAVRIDASPDYVGRSASLPAPPPVTMAGWAQFVNDRNNFSSLCALTASPRANGQLCLQTAADGTSVNLWYDSTAIGVLEPATGFSITIGTPFFWALVAEGTGANQVKAYFRNRGSNTFDTSFVATTGLGASFTPVLMRFGNADTNEFMDGRLWNIKVWDRALTAKELLAESFYRHVVYPASLHLHYLLQGDADTFDYSGNGRTATFSGGLATEPATGNHGLWVPRRQIVVARGAGGAAVALAGAAVASASASAALTHAVPLQGAALSSAVAAGALSLSVNLSGNAFVAAVAAAQMAHGVPLAGSASAGASGAGALSGGISLAGDAIATANAAAILTLSVALSGDAIARATANAEIAHGVPLAGAASAGSQAAGALSITAVLTGSASAAAVAAGQLAHGVPLSGAAVAGAQGSASLQGTAPLSGDAIAGAQAAGTLTLVVPLTAQAVANALANGALSVSVNLTGAAIARALAGGELTILADVHLQGSAVANAAGAASLSVVSNSVRPITRTEFRSMRARTTSLASRSRSITFRLN